MLKINLKGERTVGKANKGINIEKRKEKKQKKKEKGKKKIPQNCKIPTQRQRFITIENVTEYIHIQP